MIDGISDKLTRWLIDHRLLKDESYTDFDYHFRTVLFLLVSSMSLLIINYYLTTIPELLVIYVAFNVLRVYSGGYHATPDLCIIISSVLLSLIAYLAKLTIMFSSFVFFVAILVGIIIVKNIILHPPEPDEDEAEEIRIKKDTKFYVFRYINFLTLFYTIAFGCLYYHYDFVSNSISYSIFLIYLLMDHKS